jgi:hypothetical protein
MESAAEFLSPEAATRGIIHARGAAGVFDDHVVRHTEPLFMQIMKIKPEPQ